jgi:hypothetical protein
MKILTLEIKDETIADKIVWMLQHFKNDGLVIKESQTTTKDDLKASIKQSVDEFNMVKSGKLKAKPVEELLNAI